MQIVLDCATLGCAGNMFTHPKYRRKHYQRRYLIYFNILEINGCDI